MDKLLCFLCKKALCDVEENAELKRTSTSHTQTNLLVFIQGLSGIKLEEDAEPYVCPGCLELIEDLDLARKQCAELQKRLLSFLGTEELNGRASIGHTEVRVKRQVNGKEADASNGLRIHENRKLRSADVAMCGLQICSKEMKENEEHHIVLKQDDKNCEGGAAMVVNCAPLTSKLTLEDEEFLVGEKDAPVKENKKTDIKLAVKKRGVKKREPGAKSFKCEQCGKLWRSRSDLRMHELTHDNTRPFICEMCGQAYRHKAALDVHVGMHNGVNPFTCVYCNKAFTQKGALHRHMPIHTGEYPYQCELCGKRFMYHTSFNIHMVSHTGHKAYKCELCGTALMSASHLKRHMRVHTGEKRFECPTCGKRFAERYNLVSHQKLHENPPKVKPAKFRCPVCESFFEKRYKLTEHITKDHHMLNYESFNFELGFPHFPENYEQQEC